MKVLAIDQGTSGTKAVVVDESGAVLGQAERAVHPAYLADGGVEQDPRQLLASVLEVGQAALSAAGGPVDVVALANQGETVLAWDPQTGEPDGPALVWQDGRAASICDELSADAAWVAQRTGLVLDPYFSAPKMTWLRRHRTSSGVVTTTDTWLVHHLTGAFVTDATTASRSLLLDIDTVAWDDELLALFGLQDERLPGIVRGDEVVGVTSAFGGDVPVAGLVVDQQAALIAESCLEPGTAKCTYGTGAFLLATCGAEARRSANGLTTSVAWSTRTGVAYCIDGQVFTAASAVRWLSGLGLIADARDLDEVSDVDAGGVQFVPALAGMAAPWWRADARASFTGLSLATTREALVRAVVEGIAAQVAALVEVVDDDSGHRIETLRVDGGLTQSRALMQAQADLLQRPVEVYASPDATALGAAMLGRLAMTPQASLADVAWPWAPAATYEPQWSAERAAEAMGRWREAVAVACGDGESR